MQNEVNWKREMSAAGSKNECTAKIQWENDGKM